MFSFLTAIKTIDKVNAKKLSALKYEYDYPESCETMWDVLDYYLEHPDKMEKQIDILNFNFGMECDKNFASYFYFWETFKKRIQDPSEETLKNADHYPSWYKMCCALKFLFGEYDEIENLVEEDKQGLELFKMFSSLSEKYDERETEKMWKNCKPTFGSLGHVYKLIPKKKILPILNRKELIKLKG